MAPIRIGWLIVDATADVHLAAGADRGDVERHWIRQPGRPKQAPLSGGKIQRPDVGEAAFHSIKTARNVDHVLARQRLVLGAREGVTGGRIAGTRCQPIGQGFDALPGH